MKTKLKKNQKEKSKHAVQQTRQDQTIPPDKDEVLMGKRVVVQTRWGHIISGVYRGIARGDIYLTDAEVVGIYRRARVSCVYIPLTNFGHMHPEPETVQKGGMADDQR